jgi:hypothetical protein
MQIGKEAIAFPLFINNMIIYVESPEKVSKKY